MFASYWKSIQKFSPRFLFGLLFAIAIILGIQQGTLDKARKTANSSAVHFTRANLNQLQQQMKSPRYQMADFDANQLGQTIPSAKVTDQDGHRHQVVLWDSWPVTDQNGYLADYHGYHLTIALSAIDKRRDKKGVKMVLLAQKANSKNQGLDSWLYLGPLFNTFTEGAQSPDLWLSRLNNEWSGSAVQMQSEDDHIRLFYTGAMTEYGQAQALTTASVSIQPKDGQDWAAGLTINHQMASDHKTVFTGDGTIYQRKSQLTNQKTDSFAMRDPHFVVDHGHYYLVFEGNTTSRPAQTLQNPANFGSLAFFKKDRAAIDQSTKDTISQTSNVSLKSAVGTANSAIGLLELNHDFTVKTVEQPLMVSSAANDITERPNLFKYEGKWYLFTCFQGKSLASSNKQFLNQNYLLGYVSTNGLKGSYQKLNKTGLVLGSNARRKTNRFTYAYLVVPSKVKKQSQFVITAFAGDRTFAPSVELKLNGKTSTVNNTRILNQGALTTVGQHYQTNPQKWT
ncbi:glycoside hydrolase family 68 protein [Fructobacillus sp. M158]|uniref:glycoside hydrolase family 68 protein n=1 Tax=Fructobacillus parabroussonetiae TaxID=2713174 RepID=UPI00200B3807|nr:glycoside hydrolase family 68 protein [Fructobacillus parabroussonetiae]MCK8617847.1 glycoside hydrolase family 68 protein [Fructobacillus parabroussonetiae]